jgi:hypothetical protein
MPRTMPILVPVESPEFFDIVVEVELDDPMLLVELERSMASLRVGSGTLPLSSQLLDVNAGQAGVVAVTV